MEEGAWYEIPDDAAVSTVKEPKQRAKICAVWIGGVDRIAPFHVVDTHELQTFSCLDYFMRPAGAQLPALIVKKT